MIAPIRGRALPLLLLLCLCGILTLTLQSSAGTLSIYAGEFEGRRLVLHEAILHNELPEGVASWTDLGANSTNIRIGAVYLCEAMHRTLGVSVLQGYWLIDTGGLFLAFLLLYVFLRHWLDPLYSVIGVLYIGGIAPLTFLFGYFHPWDRISLLAWISLFLLVRSERLVWLGFALVVSVAIKFDTVVLPGLYWLYRVPGGKALRVTLETLALFCVSFGAYFGLRLLLPGGFESASMLGLLAENLDRIVGLTLRFPPVVYPPFLAFALPVLLIVLRFPRSDPFVRAGVAFAAILSAYFFIGSHFEEVRAEMPLVILLLPAALCALREILDRPEPGPAEPANPT